MAPGDTFRSISAADFDPITGVHRMRKVTGKSIRGCEACKMKKVKCDELRPSCTRCLRNSRRCIFKGHHGHHSTEFPTNSMGTSISALSKHTAVPECSLLPGIQGATTPLELIRHCLLHWDSIFEMPQSEHLLDLMRSRTLVLNALLAVSATHLRIHTPQSRAHLLAEYHQQHVVVREYRRALAQSNRQQNLENMTTVLVAATLLKITAFALPATETSTDGEIIMDQAWIYSKDPGRLNWMALQSGLRPLIKSSTSIQNELLSRLGSTFLGDERASEIVAGIAHSLPKNTPKHWLSTFALNETSPGSDGCDSPDPYLVPLTAIANLRNLQPYPRNILLHLSFMGKWTANFRSLVSQDDVRAIWLVGYWLGLMCRFEQAWWSRQRATRDYEALCRWLSRNPGLNFERNSLWGEMMHDLREAPFRNTGTKGPSEVNMI